MACSHVSSGLLVNTSHSQNTKHRGCNKSQDLKRRCCGCTTAVVPLPLLCPWCVPCVRAIVFQFGGSVGLCASHCAASPVLRLYYCCCTAAVAVSVVCTLCPHDCFPIRRKCRLMCVPLRSILSISTLLGLCVRSYFLG